MGLLNLCMKKHPFSRAFHFVLILPCAVLAVMAAISLGSFVPLHLDIRDYSDGSGAGSNLDLETCILFATPDRENRMVDYQPDNACDFTIWGQVAVGSLAIAMATVLFVKAFLGIKVFSWFALIELLLSLGGFFFTIALGVVITIGLDDTCRAFQTINDLEEDSEFMPCEEYRYGGDSNINFYAPLNTLRIVTWVESVLLFLLLLWFALVALLKCATCCARMGSGKPKPTKLENDTKANANADAN